MTKKQQPLNRESLIQTPKRSAVKPAAEHSRGERSGTRGGGRLRVTCSGVLSADMEVKPTMSLK